MKHSILLDLISFIRNPKVDSKLQFGIGAKFFNVLRLLCLDGFLSMFLVIPVVLVSSLYDVGENAVSELTTNAPIWIILLYASVAGPLIEEIAFRLFLSRRKRVFGFGLGALIGFMVISLVTFEELGSDFITTIAPLLIMFLFPVVGLLLSLSKSSTKLFQLYKKHFRLAYYFSIISFGLIHAFNYPNITRFWYLAPLLVLPQLAGGLIFGYIRVNYGFLWGFLAHGVYNFAALASIIAYRLGSEDLIKKVEDQNSLDFETLNNLDKIIFVGVTVYAFVLFCTIVLTTLSLLIEAISAHRHNKKLQSS